MILNNKLRQQITVNLFLVVGPSIQLNLSIIIFLLIGSLSFLFVISAKYLQIPTEARTESFVDTTNNLEVSFEAPNYWNSGTLSATIPKLDWKVHDLITASDDATTFFTVTSLPSLA